MSVATLIEFDNFGIPLDLRCFLIGQARVMIDESWLDVKYPSTENPVGKKNITRKSFFFFFFLFSELQPSHYSFLKTGKKKKKTFSLGTNKVYLNLMAWIGQIMCNLQSVRTSIGQYKRRPKTYLLLPMIKSSSITFMTKLPHHTAGKTLCFSLHIGKAL